MVKVADMATKIASEQVKLGTSYAAYKNMDISASPQVATYASMRAEMAKSTDSIYSLADVTSKAAQCASSATDDLDTKSIASAAVKKAGALPAETPAAAKTTVSDTSWATKLMRGVRANTMNAPNPF